ncbi:uncharacterized protein LOC134770772 [Penaeus indicus]|uniref:uncharacterized protein LOC134770772 n=1 Tax=Penaeus indicus TaxID=29960 RepID=UPI00300D455A
MYTSGSSGRPKGVELTHGNIVHAIMAFSMQVDVHSGDRYLAYLPLAHSPKVMSGTLGDAQVAKPTYMNAVPLVLDRIVKGVNNVAQDQGFLKQKIFSKALEIKKKQSAPEFVNKILDFVVFNKVKDQLGGDLRLIVVGGAPLSADTHTNIRAMFGCNVQVGYGATETTACISGAVTSDQRTGHCGAPC